VHLAGADNLQTTPIEVERELELTKARYKLVKSAYYDSFAQLPGLKELLATAQTKASSLLAAELSKWQQTCE
jgi:hypothetical protein